MNSLARIKQLDEKLKALDRIINQGNFLAAGTKFDLTVGVSKEDEEADFSIELGFFADLNGIVQLIRKGIIDTRTWYVRQAKEEMEKLQDFFRSEPQ